VLNLQDESMETPTKRQLVNSIYQDYAKNSPYLKYSDEQHVSTDIIGSPFAAALIEGSETHTRTGSLKVNLSKLGCNIGPKMLEVPVTQAVVYAWYDNELGSYTNMLGDRTVSMAEQMI